MKKYNVGLEVAGSVYFVLEIMSKNFNAAINEWARVTGHIDPLWNKEQGTYFGWSVVETTIPALQRKSLISNPFMY